MQVCPSCGVSAPPGTNFCPNCGATMGSPASGAPPPPDYSQGHVPQQGGAPGYSAPPPQPYGAPPQQQYGAPAPHGGYPPRQQVPQKIKITSTPMGIIGTVFLVLSLVAFMVAAGLTAGGLYAGAFWTNVGACGGLAIALVFIMLGMNQAKNRQRMM